MPEVALVLLALAVLLAIPTAAEAERSRYDVRVFARVGDPGQPEPIAIGADGNAYVGTNQQGLGDAGAPSRVFVFSPAGTLVHQYTLAGQRLDEDHGIQGLAFDADGLLYALDRAADPRVVVLDPATGAQADYARLSDVPPCSSGQRGNCSDTRTDQPAGPDYAVFAPDGSLYVTDIDQALIWRVPRGGGQPEVWFTDPRLESVYGPNGIQFLDGGRTLLFVNTASNPNAGNPTTGRLYKLPVQADGRPGSLTQFWESRPADAPDGFALAKSGRIYLALAGSSQIVVVSPNGDELARFPASPIDNQRMEVPFDGPASAAFLGDRLLVTNQSPIAGNRDRWAVLDVFAGEPGRGLFHPVVRPRPGLPLLLTRLAVRPRRVPVGRRVRFRFQATLVDDAGRHPLAGARIRFAGRRLRTGRTGRASVRVGFRRRGRYAAVLIGPATRTAKATVRVVRRRR
jgi:sugar lactone lactonase YvrE